MTRFGYNYINTICELKGVQIVVLHCEDKKTIEEELTEDMMSLLACFSGRLYGLQSHKNKAREKVEEDEQTNA